MLCEAARHRAARGTPRLGARWLKDEDDVSSPILSHRAGGAGRVKFHWAIRNAGHAGSSGVQRPTAERSGSGGPLECGGQLSSRTGRSRSPSRTRRGPTTSMARDGEGHGRGVRVATLSRSWKRRSRSPRGATIAPRTSMSYQPIYRQSRRQTKVCPIRRRRPGRPARDAYTRVRLANPHRGTSLPPRPLWRGGNATSPRSPARRSVRVTRSYTGGSRSHGVPELK